MSNPVTQQLPLTLMAFAFGANVLNGHSGMASSNVATLEWRLVEELPTQCSPGFIGRVATPATSSAGLSLRALAKAALPNSRPVEDWEKKASDDFFWSQFS